MDLSVAALLWNVERVCSENVYQICCILVAARTMERNQNADNFWQIIAFSSELGKSQSEKRKLHGIPILIWRDSANNVHAVADVCQHKRSPLNVSCFNKNELTCPYHGWRYDGDGQLIEIPSAVDFDVAKLNCRLTRYATEELDGTVWILLGQNKGLEPNDLAAKIRLSGNWKTHTFFAWFKTDLEPLIDNFMDATHTAFTHKGLIRGHGEKVKHTVNVITQGNEVRAEFAPTTERIALGLRFFLGKEIAVRHTDTFLFPNMVRVDYYFNEVHRFNALIVCSETREGNTKASIRLSYHFNWLNPIVRLLLPRLVRKIIAQDQEITALQHNNRREFPEQKEHFTACDLIQHKVELIRRHQLDGIPLEGSESSIQFYL